MNQVSRLFVRALLTTVGWAIGGYLIAWAILAIGALIGAGDFGFPDDPLGFLSVVVGAMVFVLLSAVLLASGSTWAASRRAMAVVGALAMLGGFVVFELVAAGGGLAVVGESPDTVLVVILVGAVLGWCSLAIGGVRE